MTNDIETETAPVAAPAPIETEADAKAAAKKALADKIAARVEELKTFEGKTFARNDGIGLPAKVVKYAGILTAPDGSSYYAFTVEIAGHARWNPSATDFLNEYHVIEVPAETEINSEPK